MIVIGQVHKIRKDSSSKTKALVSLIVSDPDEIIRIPLFEIHERQGLIDQFQKLHRKTITVPITTTIYKDRLAYSLSYGAQVKELNK